MKRHAMRLVAIITLIALPRTSLAQLRFEQPPIDYHNAPVNDVVSRLQKRLDNASFKLSFDERHGYLPSLLEALNIPVSSQVLVFSKTSLQLRHIDPHHPRAIYFNDEVYVGNTRNGKVIEISAVDDRQGAVFYTLNQQESVAPRFVRDKGQCLTCHASSRTEGVPGHLVRSVYPDRGGHPMIGSGTFTTDHSSPFSQRWGGWYVSGTHGRHRHMGNVTVTSALRREKLDVEDGANVTDLSERFNVEPYLTPHSDIVALMVLEHQTKMHNLITRAGFEVREALHHDRFMNRVLERSPDYRSQSTTRRIETVADRLLEYLLFCGEFALESPVRGTSGFAKEFAERGPHDKLGRSLFQLDLTTRMMKFPCSYLIYSSAFERLPSPVLERVSSRLMAVLRGADAEAKFAHLSPSDREAILEILTETKPDLFAFDVGTPASQ